MKRTLGRSGIEVSALGMGCWAIGGPSGSEAEPTGWSTVDDAESTRAIQAALDMGVTFFDTAPGYGHGHSERVLGRALKGRRAEIVLATKFGYEVDEAGKRTIQYGPDEAEIDAAPHVRENLESSLKRLDTDYLDVFQLHLWGLSIERALEVRDVLEALVKEGKIRTYGWSTDRIDAIEAFSTLPACGVAQQALNIMDGSLELLGVCEKLGLASINRSPLGMGMLTGRLNSNTKFAEDDIRKNVTWFAGIKDGRPNQAWLDSLEAIRAILTSGGRTLAQGALAWLWGRSPNTIPIPGFRNAAQVKENAGALAFGPLTPAQMAEIDRILGR
jgi:aryl-alcohol dehydrogenase-like predicted oxidoreductase